MIYFSLIIANNKRSFAYIKELFKEKYFPKEIIVLDNKDKKILSLAKKNNLKVKFLNTKNINSPKAINYIKKNKIYTFIYSGYASEIIKNNNLLKLKKFIHAHPGKIPEFKGSTTIFYSFLKNRTVYCSVFRMSKVLDSGKLIFLKKFNIKPKDLEQFDVFDYRIRIQTIIEALKTNFKYKKVKIIKKKFIDYHVAHPIIRSLVKKKVKA